MNIKLIKLIMERCGFCILFVLFIVFIFSINYISINYFLCYLRFRWICERMVIDIISKGNDFKE